ncbi:PAS domain S-box-containing protein [Nitrobacteraceae bacterium AZCC 1564]
MTAPSAIVDALLATKSDGIVATDRDGLITFWNPGAARIFGYTANEAIGQSLDIIIPENLRARHWAGYREVMATGHSRYGEGDTLSVPAMTKFGKRISVDFTVAMLHDPQQNPNGMVALLRDVTHRFEEIRSLKRKLAESVRCNLSPFG